MQLNYKFCHWLFAILLIVWKVTEDVHDNQSQSLSEFVKKWKNQTREGCLVGQQRSDKRKKRDIRRYDKHIPSLATLQPGDSVLVRHSSQRGGTGNLRNCWEERVYKVVSAMADLAVTYKIIPENVDKTKERTVHRNMLLNYDNLLDKFKWDLDDNVSGKRTGKKKQTPTPSREKERLIGARGNNNRTVNNADSNRKTGFDSDIECIQFTPHEISNYFGREKECGKKISEQKEDEANKENSDEHESEDTKGGENDQTDFSEE